MSDGIGSKLSKIVMFILLSILLVSFAIWGVGDLFRNSAPAGDVAKVGGATIKERELQQAVSYETRNLQSQFGGKLPDELIKAFGVEQKALSLLINRKLLELEAKDLGVEIGEKQIIDMIRGDREFYNKEGKFDKRLFEQFLGNFGYSEKQFYNNLRSDIATELLINALSSNNVVITEEVAKLHSYLAEKRKARLLIISPDYIKEIPAPGQDELGSFYEQKKEGFRTPEYRDISYVSLGVEDVASNIDTSEARLKEQYEAIKSEFVVPQKRIIEQIVFSDKSKAGEASVLIEGGKDFYQIAKDKAGQSKEDTVLGELTKEDITRDGLISEEIADKIFEMKEGEASEPLESKIGLHIFRVAKIIPEVTENFEQVKDEVKKRVLEDEAVDLLSSLANKIQDELASGSKLEEISGKFNLKQKKTGSITNSGEQKDGKPYENMQEISMFLEKSFAAEQNILSDIISSDDGLSYYIFRVDGITPERLQTLDEIKSRVTDSWREFKKQDMLKTIAEKAAGDARVSSLEKVAENLKLKLQDSAEFYRDSENNIPSGLAQEIFEIEKGKSTGEYQQQDGGYIIAELSEVIPADSKDKSRPLEQTRMEITAQLNNDIMLQYLEYLKARHKVKVFKEGLSYQ